MGQNIKSERLMKELSFNPETSVQDTLSAIAAFDYSPHTDFYALPFQRSVSRFDASANGGNLPNVRDFSASDNLFVKRFRYISPLMSVGLSGFIQTLFLPDTTGRIQSHIVSYYKEDPLPVVLGEGIWIDRPLMLGEWVDINSPLKWNQDPEKFRISMQLYGWKFRLDASRMNSAYVGSPLELCAEIEIAHTLETVAP
jgi:hypothetical protein